MLHDNLLVDLFGLLATLGLPLHDQRNAEMYSALIQRAKWLEAQFGVAGALGALRNAPLGGQFRLSCRQ
jgi:hypothetical protein